MCFAKCEDQDKIAGNYSTMTTAYPSEFVVIICCVFVGQTVAGLLLNTYVMYKWYRDRQKTGKKAIKGGQNFITSLKIIDLIICAVVIPFAFAVLITNNETNTSICFIKEGLVMFASSGSCFGVLLISVDRYIAVTMPTKNTLTPLRIRICKCSVVVIAVVGLLLPSLCLAMGNYREGAILSKPILPCRHVVWVFQPYYLYDIYYIAWFAVAVITVSLCYRSVLQVVRRRIVMRTTTVGSSSQSTVTINLERFRKQEFKATRVAFAVVLTFLICWGPHVVVTVVQFTNPSSVIIDMVQSVCLAIAFMTTIIHPLIYSHENNDTASQSTTSDVQPRRSNEHSIRFLRNIKVTPEQTLTEVTNDASFHNDSGLTTVHKSSSTSNVFTVTEHSA